MEEIPETRGLGDYKELQPPSCIKCGRQSWDAHRKWAL